ncbi:MAG: hypothetical protein ACYC4L_11570 [Chloroflexota bacterium]
MGAGQSISLAPEEVLELQQILVDDDADAALTFLRQVVWRKVKAGQRHLINPKQGTGALD